MKIVMITVVILLCLSQKVMCFPFFTILSENIDKAAMSMAKSIKNFKYRVINMFVAPSREKLHTTSYIHQSDIKLKRTFDDFVESAVADNETDIPVFINLKCEPTALMSTPQLANLHGRRVESHVIYTKDGYLLTLHRISPRPQNGTSIQTVLLHHGLLGSSADWIMLGPTKSLPYILADRGYDVWLANARGNYYSRGHIKLGVDTEEFWRFSFQEMGEYDLPAVIDYIRTIKKSQKPINYIGHSMGATALLVLLSTTPSYNQYLRIGILLAPLAFMSNVKGPLKMLTAKALNPPEQLLRIIGKKEFMPSRKIPRWAALKYCKGPLLFCCNPLYFFSGRIPGDIQVWNISFLARLLYHVPAGGSSNTMLHYAQGVKSGKFHRFNKVKEQFLLNQITLPIVLFSSSDDWLATIPDLLRLYFSIGNPIEHYIIRGRNMTHTEFVWGPDAEKLVFKKILYYLENGLNIHVEGNKIQSDQSNNF